MADLSCLISLSGLRSAYNKISYDKDYNLTMYNYHRTHRYEEEIDESEIFKRKTLRAKRIRKLTAQVLFAVLCVLAFLMVIAVMWAYVAD